jgi:hypothetical protein
MIEEVHRENVPRDNLALAVHHADELVRCHQRRVVDPACPLADLGIRLLTAAMKLLKTGDHRRPAWLDAPVLFAQANRASSAQRIWSSV